MEKRKFYEEYVGDQLAACGRTAEEQIEFIDNNGTHAMSSMLRRQLLHSLGIKAPKDEAENVVIFGCYKPFTSPDMIREYLKLFDLLNIDYTWLEKEYCCGFPVLGQHPDQIEHGRRFNKKNIAMAEEKKAKSLIYCCIGCATAARHLVEDSTPQLRYVLDIILDAMEKRQYKISPITIGYFEGCHSWFHYNFPNGKQNWARYRSFLDTIDGLTVVDLPNNLCCKRSINQIFDNAAKMNLDHIVAPCIDCQKNLYDKAEKQITVMSYPEILLRALES